MKTGQPNGDDWKQWKKGWKYDGDIKDPTYLKDRAELLHNKENKRAPYNGWWWYQGVSNWKEDRENFIARKKLREGKGK